MKAFARTIACRTLMVIAFLTLGLPAIAQTNPITSPFENEIRTFEKSDAANPPPKNAVLFLGSSTFRKWTDLQSCFPDLKVINRGFGGSQITDSTAFAERIVFPYEPRTIVFYAGDNDLASGKSADQVVSNYFVFVKKVHDRLPHTDIDFLSIKPCPARWKLRDKVASVNAQIKAMSAGGHLNFIDITPLMIGDDGKPKADLFQADGLHPNKKCYRLWAPIIRQSLQ